MYSAAPEQKNHTTGMDMSTRQNTVEPRPTPVNVQPVQFQAFDDNRITTDRENISLIMDVPLEITVELGRTQRLIRDILEFAPGSIIELDKLAGEPIDILVNGKSIAKGEVVVIDESFGVRITDIVNPSKRL
jgi:flagellar motor switch protein FliN/FliY